MRHARCSTPTRSSGNSSTTSPTERVNALLVDFPDYGNAGATSVPRSNIRVQIAPLSYAFETITANERMNTIMNHELVHVVSMDQAAPRDLHVPDALRRQGHARCRAAGNDPVLLPDDAASRVAAVVSRRQRRLHRHLDGRRHRPRAERIRRNGVPRRWFATTRGSTIRSDWWPRGRRSTSRSEVNSYLYGTRFITWLASRYSPEARDQVDCPPARQPRLLRVAFSRPSSASRWTTRGQEWIAFEKPFQQANLDGDPEISRSRRSRTCPRDRWDRCRARSTTRRHATIFAALNYPGRGRARGVDFHRDRRGASG